VLPAGNAFGAGANFIIAATLASRHSQASVMSLEAEKYFSRLTESAPMQLHQQWEKEIQDAEQHRLADPTVMDILQTRDAHYNNLSILDNEQQGCTPAEKWIQMAIDIEEKQWVIHYQSK
jgi:hypothetical protein